MQYQGGKSRIAKPISEVIINEVSRWKVKDSESVSNCNRKMGGSNQTFVSLFCGSCAVESKLAPHFDRVICNDKHEYLIEMLKGVQSDYELPEHISEEEYRYIKYHKDEDKVLTGFVGFGCSFGGRFFEGYARNKEHTNYASQSKRSLLKDMANLKNAEFSCLDYKNVIIPDNSVVYADPPYFGTKPIHNQKFNSEAFWEYMRQISKNNQVFISEQTAPDDFECIWEKPFTRTLDRNKDNQFKVVEKLFTYKK